MRLPITNKSELRDLYKKSQPKNNTYKEWIWGLDGTTIIDKLNEKESK